MQVKVSKSKAIERLSALRDAVEGLRGLDADSPEFLKWYEDVKGAFRYVFCDKSDQMKSFSNIKFRSEYSVANEEVQNSQWARDTHKNGLDKSFALIASQIDQIAIYWPEEDALTQRGTGDEMVVAVDSKQVFVVHGRDHGTLAEVKQVLSQLGLEPVVLQDQPNQGRTIIEKFEDYAQVGFAVVICTPDDEGKLAQGGREPQPRVRQNVVFEWGYFIGKLRREKVCALIKGGVEIHSDYDGVLYVEMGDNESWKVQLARELKGAGYDVDANKLL